MLIRLILPLLLLLCSGLAKADDISLQEAKKFLAVYQKIEKSQRDVHFQKYVLLTHHIGTLSFTTLNKKVNLSLPLAQSAIGRTIEIDKRTEEKLDRWIGEFSSKGLKGQDAKDMRAAQKSAIALKEFATTLEARQAAEIHQMYQSDQFKIGKTVKHRVMHFPAELVRFGAAIVIVRMATCFGGSGLDSLGNIMSLKGPSALRASLSDPACMDEVIEMFRSPIFYTGFFAFVVGSGFANAGLMKAMAAIDPSHGPKSRAFMRSWIPQLSLAFGFISDHAVKTMLHDENIKSCLKDGLPRLLGMKKVDSESQTRTLEQVIDQAPTFFDENGQAMIDGQGAIQEASGSPACSRAARTLASDQFLKEEIGVGVAGLLTTAIALAKVGQVTQRIKTLTYAISLFGGPTGIVVGIGRMVVFLGLFELVDPVIRQSYLTGVLEPNVDRKTNSFINGYWNLDSVELLDNEKCSQHYSGFNEKGEKETCSRVPLVADLESFHDYSKAWRNKSILKDFHLSHSRWRKNLNSFFNNYFMSQETVKLLARSREVFLGGDSEYHQVMQELIEKRINLILQQGFPNQPNQQQIYEQVRQDFLRSVTEPGYVSEYKNLSQQTPERLLYDEISSLHDLELTMYLQQEGDPFYGLGSAEEVQLLVDQIMQFIETQEIRVNIPGAPYSTQVTDEVQAHLQAIGLPYQLAAIPHQMGTIRFFLESADPEDVAIGLMLFYQWAPNMKGPFPVRSRNYVSHGGPQYNPVGLSEPQYELFNQILEKLRNFSPDFKNEVIYTRTILGQKGEMEKTPEDTQFYNQAHGYNTKKISDFALTQLICGQTPSLGGLFGDDSGFSIRFPFSHIMDYNLCRQLVFPITYDGENTPTPVRSLYATGSGLKVGLHQAYIEAPADSPHPLIFKTETEASQWWNMFVLPSSMNRLKKLQQEYEIMLSEQFYPLTHASEVAESSVLNKLIKPITQLFGNQNDAECEAQRCTTVRSLSLSLQNELYHYRQALAKILPENELRLVEPAMVGVSQCLVNLLNSLPEKKYRVAKSACEPALENVNKWLITRNGKYADSTAEVNFEKAMTAEGTMTTEQIRDSIVYRIGKKIQSLFVEVEALNGLANESFQFDLNSKE